MTSISAVRINGVDLDPDTVVYSVTIQHGRSDIFSQPAPSTATVIIRGSSGLTLDVGDELKIGSYGTCRFTGNITDLNLEHQGDGTPVLTATGIGRLGLLGYRLTDPNDHVKETVRARATRILDDSGLSYLNGGTTDLELFKPSEDIPYSCTDALQSLAEWSGATFFDTPTGLVVFESYGVRGQTANSGNWQAQVGTFAATERAWNSYPTSLAALELDPDNVVFAPTWRQTSTSIVNDVSITHGDPPHVDNYTDADSITAYGRRAVELTTGLDSHADADARAAQILLAQAYPRWNLGQITLRVHDLNEATRSLALALVSGSAVVVKGLPAASPSRTFGGLVEGWTEIHTPGQQLLTLSLSDRRFSYQTVTWANVPPALIWDDVAPAIQWFDVVTAGDLEAA